MSVRKSASMSFLGGVMRRIFFGVFLLPLIVGIILVLPSLAEAQDQTRIENLLAKLADAHVAMSACADLEKLAAEDPDARQYIAKRISSLIAIAATKGDLQFWISSLKITDELKIVEAVPLLTKLLRYENYFGPTNFGFHAHLYDDLVAKALSDIGEPATQSVAALFDDGDAPTRRRAAIVLWNIGTPQASEALLRQINREPDTELRSFMQNKIDHEWPGSPSSTVRSAP
jgi:HEAT repeat protein